MPEPGLRAALDRRAPGEEEARARAREVVRAWAATSPPPARPRSRAGRRRLVALLAAVLAGLGGVGVAAARAPHSGVGHWVRGVLGAPQPRPRPALARVPGGGRLLVVSAGGAWIVAPDGARRRLGDFDGASWSPHGLFVVAWRGRQLAAVDPRGRVRWARSRPDRIDVARWSPGDGFRVAYLTGGRLRIVNGDGSGDHLYRPAMGTAAPDWRPGAAHVLAFAGADGRVRVDAVDRRRRLWASAPIRGIRQLAWSPRGDRLLVVTADRLVVLAAGGRPVLTRPVDRERSGLAAVRAAWSPGGGELAVVRRTPDGSRSQAVLVPAARDGADRVLLEAPGVLDAAVWSPSGARLLVSWPGADQWLFLRPHVARARTRAFGDVARQFAPSSSRAVFPVSTAWCCREGG